jgi:nitrogen fixation NifU-like protein
MESHNEGRELDQLVDELQSKIDEEEARDFSRTVLEEARHPTNYGPMEDPDARTMRKGTCGDIMEIFVRMRGDVISEMSYVTDGCGATLACGSMLTKKVRGMSLDEAMDITSEDLLEWLDGLPEENLHCAQLAVGTLHGVVKTISVT